MSLKGRLQQKMLDTWRVSERIGLYEPGVNYEGKSRIQRYHKSRPVCANKVFMDNPSLWKTKKQI